MKISKKVKEELKEEVLKEDVVEQTAETINAEDNIIESEDTKGDIEETLDDALEANLALHNSGNEDTYINVLFVGEAGTGKTGRIRSWAQENGVNLVQKVASKLDATDVGGAVGISDPDETGKKYAVRLSTKEFDQLDKPYSILFLDEFNRARADVRAPLLKLVNEHVLDDPNEEDGLRHYPNFLFTIAAINPPVPGYDTDELDAAEISRFRVKEIAPDKAKTLQFLKKELGKLAEQAAKTLEKYPEPKSKIEQIEVASAKKAIAATAGRLGLADKLLTTPNQELHFDTSEEVARSRENETNKKLFQPRTLTALLYACNGTKEDFLKKFNEFCNNDKFEDVKRVLSNYTDVVDKATDALKNHETESPILGTRKSRSQGVLDELGIDMN